MLVDQQRKQKNGKPTTNPTEVVHTPKSECGPSCISTPNLTETPEREGDCCEVLEEILSRANLFEALDRVEKNKGAAGIDGIQTTDMRSFLKENWPRLKSELMNGTYKPQPARRVEIPKPSGGTRLLGIPTVAS